MSSVRTDMAGSDIKNKAPESEANVTSVAATSSPSRLCYVDDSRTSAYVVKRMLRPFGYIVDHFDSAESALIALIQKNYDLLLTDLKVSPKGMDGDDLVRALRNSGQQKIASLPIIVITGSTDNDVLEAVYRAGANHILTKPVNGDELNSQILRLIHEFPQTHSASDESSAQQADDNSDLADTATAEAKVEKAQKAQKIQREGAMVLPFEHEHKNSDTEFSEVIDIDSALSDVDAIPVLSSLAEPSVQSEQHDGDETEVHANEGSAAQVNEANDKELSQAEATAHIRQDKAKEASVAVLHSKNKGRRVLAEVDETGGNGETADHDSAYLPQPKSRHTPAAQVKPSILVKQNTADSAPKEAALAARQEAARRAKAAILAAQRKQANDGKTVRAENTADNAEAAAALRKLKASAQQKALLAKKKKAVEAARAARAAKEAKAAQAAQAAAKRAQQTSPFSENYDLSADQMTLEPLEDDKMQAFSANPGHSFDNNPFASKRSSTANQNSDRQARNVNGAASGAINSSSAESHGNAAASQSKPAQLNHPMDGGITDRAVPEKLVHPFDLPPGSDPYPHNQGNNLLQEIERFPLVETQLSDHYAPSRAMTAMSSVLELYGFKRIIFMAALMVVLFFSFGSFSDFFQDGVPVDVAIVEQGEIYQAMTYPGKVVSKQKVDIVPPIAGRLVEVLVDEGDNVKKGDLLARLDDREAKTFLSKADASLNSAREDVVLAQRTLERLTQAFKKGAVARQLVEDAEVDLRSAKARESIAEEEVRSAKLGLENPRILSPFDGIVTARLVEVGQWVVPSEILFTVIDPKQREIEVKVDAADSGGIAVGQTVGLSSDAFPGLEWSESVTRLAAATTNVGNANTVSVYISLGSSAPSLRFGQQVDADIRTAWNPNAIKVPFGALISKNGRNWVAVLDTDSDKARMVEVTTGIEDFSHVEIIQGLSVGETIILANGKHIRDGERVTIAANP